MAESAVKKAESGDKTGLSEELTSMSPADRLAVAKEMVQLNNRNRQTNDSLPKVEITTEDDASGQKVLVDVKARERRGWYYPARWVGDDYESGKVVYHSRFQKYRNGATELTDYDPATGNPKSSEFKHRDGSVERYKYDPATQNRISEDMKDRDGSTHHADYDPISKNLKFEELKSADGSTIWTRQFEYDPTTGKLTSDELKEGGAMDNPHIVPGVVMRHSNKYDPHTALLQSSDTYMTSADGSTMHDVYDSKGLKSREMIYPDGSGWREEYDPDTIKPKSVDFIRVDGSTKGKN